MPKRMLQGVVVSDKQDKTVVVRVERRFTHPVLKKTVRRIEEVPRPRRDQRVPRRRHRVGSRSTVHFELKRWTVVRGEKRAK